MKCVNAHEFTKDICLLQYLVYENAQERIRNWVPNSQQIGIPQGAVIGGHDEDGQPVYITRTSDFSGYYHAAETTMEYARQTRNNSLCGKQWDFLVVTYCKHTRFTEMIVRISTSW